MERRFLAGNMAIPFPDLDASVEMKPGDVADGMKIEGAWQKVEDRIRTSTDISM